MWKCVLSYLTVTEIIEEKVPIVEKVSIDEPAYL